MTELTAEQLAEAQREGLTPEEYGRQRDVRIRQAGQSVGLTEDEFRDLMRAAEKAATTGYGISLTDWQAATNRDQYGRKKP